MSDSKDKSDEAASKTGQAPKSAAAQTAADMIGQVTSKAADVWEKTKEAGYRAGDAVSDGYDHLSSGTGDFVRKSREVTMDWERGLETYVKQKPVTMLAAGVGVGILIGLALSLTFARPHKMSRFQAGFPRF